MKDHRTSAALRRTAVGFLEYALAFTAVAECNSLFHYSENYRQTTAEVVLTVLAILLAGLLAAVKLAERKREFLDGMKRCRPVFVLLLGGIAAFFALNVLRIGAESALRKYVLSFVLFLPAAYLLFRGYRVEGRPYALFYRHADLVTVLATLNLAVYLAVSLRPELIRAFPMETRWSGQGSLLGLLNYLNVFCVSPTRTRTIAGLTFYRNMGFFPEPLMYCIPLITALFTEMFLRPREERRVLRWCLLLAAVFTTQSTLGMLLAAGAVGIKLIEGVKLKKRWLMALPAALLVGVFVFLLLMQKSDVGDNSTAAHIEHYAAAFKTFLRHPLLGCGYLREDQILLRMDPALLRRSKGLSNSVAVVLAEGGLLLGGLCMVPFFAGLARFGSREGRRVALWTLGPLGLYCVTVFHFHLLLMLFMAFGYAMLELTPAEGGRRKLTAAKGEELPEDRGLSAPERLGGAAALLLGCAAAAALFLSAGFWRALSRWLELRQLYLGQSAWKVFFFALFLLLAFQLFRQTLRAWGRKEGAWLGETGWFLLYSAGFVFLYPAAYSAAATALDFPSPFGDLFETAALAGLYFGGIAAGWLLIALRRRNKRLFALGLAAAAVLAAGVTAGARLLISRADVPDGALPPVLQAAGGEGKLYANERPAAVKRALPGLSYAPARDGAFAALEKASVLAAHDRDLRDLFAAGFRVTELSPEYLLYSNDEAVIDRLRGEGCEFCGYYPFALSLENEASRILREGTYTLEGELRMPPAEEAPHEPVCEVRILYNYGAKQIKSQTVYADEFDGEGLCRFRTAFNAGDWEGLEYLVLPAEGTELEVCALTLRETPKHLTETTYDGRCLVLREAYWDLSGQPWYHSQGYAATNMEYDRAGRLVRQSYEDGFGAPVRIQSGYASFTRTYNRRGRLSREAYYDTGGAPCLRKEGYAAVEREYDGRGNPVLLRYLGEDGLPVMTVWGYAEVRRTYNENRKLVMEEYFGVGGEPVALPGGEASRRIEYAPDGSVRAERYYDLNGGEITPE